jgi:hypothetical protein
MEAIAMSSGHGSTVKPALPAAARYHQHRHGPADGTANPNIMAAAIPERADGMHTWRIASHLVVPNA